MILAVIVGVSALPVVIEVVGKRRKGTGGQHIAADAGAE